MADHVIATADNILLQFGNTDGSPRRVDFQYGSAGTLKFQVNQNGDVTITGVMNRSGGFILNNTSGSGDLLRLQNATSTRVTINNGGHGDFAQGDLQTATVTDDPNGSRSGGPGDMVLWNEGSGTTYHWCVCTGGTAWVEVVVA